MSSDDLLREMAALVRRYYATAATDDHRTAIVNLAGLLRHATSYAAALAREIEHYVAEARDAQAEVDELQETLDAVLLDNVALQRGVS